MTGSGSGLGRDIALGLAAKKYRVFGTAMEPNEISELEDASAGAVTLSRCDITDEAAVQRWAHQVSSETGGGLDLLISNAGILTPGPLEVLPLAAREARRRPLGFTSGNLAATDAARPAEVANESQAREHHHESQLLAAGLRA